MREREREEKVMAVEGERGLMDHANCVLYITRWGWLGGPLFAPFASRVRKYPMHFGTQEEERKQLGTFPQFLGEKKGWGKNVLLMEIACVPIFL